MSFQLHDKIGVPIHNEDCVRIKFAVEYPNKDKVQFDAVYKMYLHPFRGVHFSMIKIYNPESTFSFIDLRYDFFKSPESNDLRLIIDDSWSKNHRVYESKDILKISSDEADKLWSEYVEMISNR